MKPEDITITKDDILSVLTIVAVATFIIGCFCLIAYQIGLNDCESNCDKMLVEIQELHTKAKVVANEAFMLKDDMEDWKEIGIHFRQDSVCIGCHVDVR